MVGGWGRRGREPRIKTVDDHTGGGRYRWPRRAPACAGVVGVGSPGSRSANQDARRPYRRRPVPMAEMGPGLRRGGRGVGSPGSRSANQGGRRPYWRRPVPMAEMGPGLCWGGRGGVGSTGRRSSNQDARRPYRRRPVPMAEMGPGLRRGGSAGEFVGAAKRESRWSGVASPGSRSANQGGRRPYWRRPAPMAEMDPGPRRGGRGWRRRGGEARNKGR